MLYSYSSSSSRYGYDYTGFVIDYSSKQLSSGQHELARWLAIVVVVFIEVN